MSTCNNTLSLNAQNIDLAYIKQLFASDDLTDEQAVAFHHTMQNLSHILYRLVHTVETQTTHTEGGNDEQESTGDQRRIAA